MIRVLIADDFPLMIDVMRRMIARAEDMSVAGVVTNFTEVLQRILEIEHEVVLMNDYLYPTTSVSATEKLRDIGVDAPILIIAIHRDSDLIRESLAAGADGYIFKEEFAEHLLPAIRTVYSGERYLSPIVAEVLGDQA
jgi:two-component system, NarL family, invasion response regulator UvrY